MNHEFSQVSLVSGADLGVVRVVRSNPLNSSKTVRMMSVDPNIFPNIYCLLRIACTIPVTSLHDHERTNSTALTTALLNLYADYHDDSKTVWLRANEHTLSKARGL